MSALKSFEKQQYLSLETFRKNGNGVKTPVWFAQEGEKLFIWTESTSGKAKRIRNTGTVKIAPSKADGTPVSEWLAATAAIDDSEAALQHLNGLMSKKYGLAFALFAFLGKLQRSKHASIRVEVNN